VLHAALRVAAKQARDDGDDETAAALDAEADGIENDLLESARLAVDQVRHEACYTRTGHHSATTGEWRDGQHLIAALFPHHISRDGDPQLHVHIAFANLVQRADVADDQWR
jgi:conjugative relaxase-like TrwC/TraI family protein